MGSICHGVLKLEECEKVSLCVLYSCGVSEQEQGDEDIWIGWRVLLVVEDWLYQRILMIKAGSLGARCLIVREGS